MNSLRIFLPIKALDSYIYSGYLFAIFKDGTLRTLPLSTVYDKLSRQFPKLESFFKLSVIRNDWLTNKQAQSYLDLPKVYETIKSEWDKITKIGYRVKVLDKDWTVLDEIKTMPTYDIHVYAMRVYLSNRDGVYEGVLPLNRKTGSFDFVDKKKYIHKVFDARTISISSKAGGLLFSADQEGLFHGSLWDAENRRISIKDNSPIAKTSLRTGWSSFDTINYETQSSFSYFKNASEKQEHRPYLYSASDDDSRKTQITKFGIDEYSMKEFMGKTPLDNQDVSFCFNSSQACFFFLKSGEYNCAYISKYKKQGIRLSSRIHSLPPNDRIIKEDKIIDIPCSASIFPLGTVIEYFDHVDLVLNNEIVNLETTPAISVRTFPSSLRFRRLICITKEDGIALHSIFPPSPELSSLKSFNL